MATGKLKPKLNRHYTNKGYQVEIVPHTIFNMSFTFKEFEEKLAEIKAKIPAEFLDSTKVELIHEKEWFSYEPEPFVHGGMKVTYLRPETKEEEADRLEENRAIREANDAKEKAELARLQVKFANKT